VTADPDKQWRIDSARHLKGVSFIFRRYAPWSESWDHDHCAACGAKFAVFEAPDILHEGFATSDAFANGAAYEWVCPTCFADLKDTMQWVVVEE
jgi:hypothetical protein